MIGKTKKEIEEWMKSLKTIKVDYERFFPTKSEDEINEISTKTNKKG